MRQLAQGMTLIELLVTLAVAAVLLVAGLPHLSDFIANARLREGGGNLLSAALLAQSEAIKRNHAVRLTIGTTAVRLTDLGDAESPVLVREIPLPDGVEAAPASLAFGGDGRPRPAADAAVHLSMPQRTCSGELRCPWLRVDAGGSIQLCRDRTASCE